MDINLNLSGTVNLEGSKSIINRLLIITTYLTKPIEIINYSTCNDVKTLENNLKLMGIRFEKNNGNVTIYPRETKLQNKLYYISDSGTAYRFLLARLAALEKYKTSLEISYSLKKRPSKILFDALNKLGASLKTGKYPIEIFGKKLYGGKLKIDSTVSSQYASAILLISPYFKNDLELSLGDDIVSFSYLLMTLKIMKKFGIKYFWGENMVIIPSGQSYQNLDSFEVEPDFSSASYFAAIGALSPKGVFIKFNGRSSLQPDYKIFKILKGFGAYISYNDNGILIKKDKLEGQELDLRDSPDIVPTIAILSLFARSKTVIKNIQHLKYKESNRIISLLTQIKKIGADIHYVNDKLIINPLKNEPPRVLLKTFLDHRMVMSFSILKAIFPQIDVENPHLISKSYPNFYDVLSNLKQNL